MKRALTLMGAALVLAPAGAALPAERRLLVDGDSPAEGTRPRAPA